MKIKILAITTSLFLFTALSAQVHRVRIYGYVVDENNRSIEGAAVFFEHKNIGTSTNHNGYYDLNVELADSVTLVFSHLGYQTVKHTIFPQKKVIQITVELPTQIQELKEVNITSIRRQTSTMETLDPSKYKLTPNASGNFESMLITFAGVSSNNELSSQYNVRGGNFDENIVYINGIEIYRPLLIRAGQQEGLSFINSDMVGQVGFSSGGYNVEYGDKMSSVLDIIYKKPKSFEASAMVSLLGASAYVGTANKRFTQMHGFRYKTSKYLLGTLDTKGEYKPSFLDYQTYLTYRLSPKWELSFLGNISQNNFTFIPDSQRTSFGTYNMAEKLEVYFDGQEKDLFQTAFGALTLNFKPKENLKLGLTASAFHTNENETYDITGQYLLGELKMDMDPSKKDGALLGVGTYHEHARNRLKATVVNIAHTGEFTKSGHTLKWSAGLQREIISDRINEWEWRDSAGYSMPYKYDKVVDLYYNLKSKNTLDSWRTTAYIQDTYRWDTDGALYALTGGIRTNFWTFNKEFLISPRVAVSILPHWDKDFSFRFATGVYYQSPFYKEMRDTVSDQSGNVFIHLNKNIKAQRSLHFVLGGDYYFRMLGRPFKFTTETYLKLADRVITYSVDNVRIRYSGENDAKAYTAGIDFKLFGELVPGTDSWVNFSLMQSKEDILNDSYIDKKTGQTIYPGWIPRPNEQRYSFSMLFSDYLPNNPKYQAHLKIIYADALPFGPPRSQRYQAVFRSSNAYKRVDIGVSRAIVSGSDKLMDKAWLKHIKTIWLNAEIFNLFDFNNVNSYYWVSDINKNQHAVPNYLTGRQFNLKLMVDIK